MTDIKITTVPRDLYYHEVAYVLGLEADNKRLRQRIDTLLAERDAERKTYNDAIADLIADNKRLRAEIEWLREVVAAAVPKP